MIKYSVIIPCLNEAQALEASLSSLIAASEGRSDIDVLLVDNGSTDQSIAIARRHGINVMQIKGVSISALRNNGARSSNGCFLLFLDADMQVPNDWFQLLDRYADDDNTDVVGFVDRVPEHAPWFARIWGLRASARRQTLMQVDALPGRNLMLSRLWFDRVGGFNEALITGEDKEFVFRLHRAGARVLSVPGAALYHSGYEKSFSEWCRKEYWRQHSHIGLLQSQGMHFRLLRFPLLAIGHLAVLLMVLASLLSAAPGLPVWLVIWFAPALIQSAGKRTSRWPVTRLFQFSILYWIRFHIAGVSVLREAWEKRRRGSLLWS